MEILESGLALTVHQCYIEKKISIRVLVCWKLRPYRQLGSGLCTLDLKMNKVKYENKECIFYLVMFCYFKIS